MENGKIIGLNDVIESIKAEDNGVFVDDANPPAVFTTQIRTQEQGKTYNSVKEIMAIKDTAKRQKAIAENMELFLKE